MVTIILAITSARAIKTQAQQTAKHEMRALRAKLQSLSCLRHLSVNLVGWNGVDSHVRRILDTHDESFCIILTLSLLSCFACGLFIGRGDGTSGQTSVRVPIRADMTAAVATRRRAFQYSLMHRQNCENPETRGVIIDHVLARLRVTYTQLERRGAHARGRWCVCVCVIRRAVSLCIEYNYLRCAPHVFQEG